MTCGRRVGGVARRCGYDPGETPPYTWHGHSDYESRDLGQVGSAGGAHEPTYSVLLYDAADEPVSYIRNRRAVGFKANL